MSQYNHDNILSLKSLMVNECNVTIVSDMLHMNLFEYLNKRQNKFIENELKLIFK